MKSLASTALSLSLAATATAQTHPSPKIVRNGEQQTALDGIAIQGDSYPAHLAARAGR